jgi:DNA-directed RNA polymerase subunit RPC12/RpoP
MRADTAHRRGKVTILTTRQLPARLHLNRRTVPTTGIEVEYFCRGCKGHYSRTVSLKALREIACRCGSRDLLVYSVASEISAPLRAG